VNGARWFRRVMAGDAAAYAAAGWRAVADDWSDSVGPLVLVEGRAPVRRPRCRT